MVDNAFCLNCEKKETCKEICPELEKTLPKDWTGKLWKEFDVDPQKIDKVFQKSKDRESGSRKEPKIYED